MFRALVHALARAVGREPTGAEARLRGLLERRVQRGRRVAIGDGVRFVAPERIRLGDRVSIFGDAVLNANGPDGRIEIGNGSHVDHFCVLYGQGGLTIGRQCAIAAGVVVYTQTNQYRDDPERPVVEQPVVYAPVAIGDDVWIGARAVVLPGVRIGDHAVVGAGAVVREDVAPWTIVAGVPARVVGDRRASASALVSGPAGSRGAPR